MHLARANHPGLGISPWKELRSEMRQDASVIQSGHRSPTSMPRSPTLFKNSPLKSSTKEKVMLCDLSAWRNEVPQKCPFCPLPLGDDGHVFKIKKAVKSQLLVRDTLERGCWRQKLAAAWELSTPYPAPQRAFGEDSGSTPSSLPWPCSPPCPHSSTQQCPLCRPHATCHASASGLTSREFPPDVL